MSIKYLEDQFIKICERLKVDPKTPTHLLPDTLRKIKQAIETIKSKR